MERQRAREKLQEAKTDIHYLKNVVLKLYETGSLPLHVTCRSFFKGHYGKRHAVTLILHKLVLLSHGKICCRTWLVLLSIACHP